MGNTSTIQFKPNFAEGTIVVYRGASKLGAIVFQPSQPLFLRLIQPAVLLSLYDFLAIFTQMAGLTDPAVAEMAKRLTWGKVSEVNPVKSRIPVKKVRKVAEQVVAPAPVRKKLAVTAKPQAHLLDHPKASVRRRVGLVAKV